MRNGKIRKFTCRTFIVHGLKKGKEVVDYINVALSKGAERAREKALTECFYDKVINVVDNGYGIIDLGFSRSPEEARRLEALL